MDKFKLVKRGNAGILSAIKHLSDNFRSVDCEVEGSHLHLYINDKNSLMRLFPGERKRISSFRRTDEYLQSDETLEEVAKLELCRIKDNLDYLQLNMNHPAKRQEHVQELVDNTVVCYTFDYGYNLETQKYGYGYGHKIVNKSEPEWKWVDISTDTYTPNEVRDVFCMYRFYKIVDGKLEYKEVSSFDEIDPEYPYFKENDLVQTYTYGGYYLPEKTK